MSDRSIEKYEKQKAMSRDWKKRHAERHAELARYYRERNKEKTKAQNKLNYAIRKGKICRGACEKCGTISRVHGHHHDYNKPYDVRWLCFQCHKDERPVTDESKRVKIDCHQHASLQGEDNCNASLKDDDVRGIRKLLESGMSQEKIGKLFNVSQVTVSRIKLGKNWIHVK